MEAGAIARVDEIAYGRDVNARTAGVGGLWQLENSEVMVKSTQPAF